MKKKIFMFFQVVVVELLVGSLLLVAGAGHGGWLQMYRGE